MSLKCNLYYYCFHVSYVPLVGKLLLLVYGYFTQAAYHLHLLILPLLFILMLICIIIDYITDFISGELMLMWHTRVSTL